MDKRVHQVSLVSRVNKGLLDSKDNRDPMVSRVSLVRPVPLDLVDKMVSQACLVLMDSQDRRVNKGHLELLDNQGWQDLKDQKGHKVSEVEMEK